MSRFYDAVHKAASGSNRTPPTLIGSGEALAPRRRDTPPPAVPFRSRSAPTQDKQGVEWLHLLYILHKHWKISVLFAVVLMVTVIIVTFNMKAIYSPVARIEVDPPGEQFSLEGGPREAIRSTWKLKLKISKATNWRWTLSIDFIWTKVRDGRPRRSLMLRICPLSTDFGGVLGTAFLPCSPNVKRDTASRLISVSFSSYDPKMAALVTNTVVDAFIDDTFRTSTTRS